MPVLATPLDELCQSGQLLTSSQGREVFAVTYEGIRAPMIVKHLSIPATQAMVNGLIYSGAVADEQAALDYYRAEMDDLRQELSRLEPMHDDPHFLPYLDCEIKEKTDGIGFDIYLLTLRAETVRTMMTRRVFTPQSALTLGISVAGTLYALRQQGLLHRNIHPGNLYRDPGGTFRLGDLGTLPLSDLQYATQPDRYICEYTAPELCDVLGVPNETVDTYALGMVLWTIFNGYEPPFGGDEERRRSGEALPAPTYASDALADVLRHACAPNPGDRYASPEELKAALEPLLEIASDEPILPPLPEPAEAPAETPADSAAAPEAEPDASAEDAPAAEAPAAPAEDEAAADAPAPKEDEAATDEPAEAAPPAPLPPPEPSQRFQTAFAAAYEEEDGFPDDLTADPSRVRRPSRLWLKILIPILIVAILAAGAFGGVYYLRHRAYVIDQLSLQLEGKDTLRVEIDAPADALLTVVLSDEEGRVLQSLPYNGEPLRFGNLDAGKEFTVTLQSRNERELEGVLTSKASTPMPTELLTFDATTLSPTEIALEFTSTGYEPSHWTLTFSNEAGDSQTSSFSGHSLVINGLDAGSAYTFTITDAENQPVLGTSTVTCETETVVNLTSFELDDSVYGELTVRWASSGNFAKSWYLTCSGSDGSYRAEEITDQSDEFSYTLEDLPAGCSYEVQLSCEGLTNPADATRTIELPLCTVTDFVAYATDSTTMKVSWNFINGEQPAHWRLTCTNDSLGETQTFLLAENTCDIPNLLPNAEYRFELSAENGLLVGGCDPVTARTPEAGQFDDYRTSGIFLGFFAMPSKANWGLSDLRQSTATFAAGGGMAFAVEVSYQYTANDKHVNTLYIIRDNNDDIVQYTSGELSWAGSSVKETHFGGFPQCPNKAGEYTLELYFNGKLLTSKKFNVV